jgi:hypothetical protein
MGIPSLWREADDDATPARICMWLDTREPGVLVAIENAAGGGKMSDGDDVCDGHPRRSKGRRLVSLLSVAGCCASLGNGGTGVARPTAAGKPACLSGRPIPGSQATAAVSSLAYATTNRGATRLRARQRAGRHGGLRRRPSSSCVV